jgi:hypothetical protein
MNKYLLCFISIIFSVGIHAENIRSQSQPLTLDNRIFITNKASKRLHFNVRPNNGRWSSYYLDSGKGMEIKCNKCETDSFEFEMKTEARVVRYKLPNASKYKLAWNKNKKLWDLFNYKE